MKKLVSREKSLPITTSCCGRADRAGHHVCVPPRLAVIQLRPREGLVKTMDLGRQHLLAPNTQRFGGLRAWDRLQALAFHLEPLSPGYHVLAKVSPAHGDQFIVRLLSQKPPHIAKVVYEYDHAIWATTARQRPAENHLQVRWALQQIVGLEATV